MMRQGDEIYFHAGGEPTSGKVVCHGKHGATVKDAAGQHHRVKYENVLGHKSKSTPAMSVVDQGVDGAIVADEGGKKSYVHGLQPGDEPEDAPVQPKGFEMLGKALVLFAKSGPIKNRPGLHLEKRTDKLGHQSGHWVKGQEADPAPREAAQPDPEDQRGSKNGYGTHNIEPGDRVNFDVGGQAGDGEITAAGKDGATVKTDTGDQKVFWHEIRGHQAKKKEAGGEAEKKQPVVLGKQEPIPADDFSAAGYAKSHDLADVTPESILAGFPEDTAGKIAAAQDRLKSIEQTIDQFKHDGHWDAKREALHAKILFDGAMVKNEKGKDEWEPGLFSAEKVKSATPVPGEKPKFIILGGRGGSGKSSFKNSVYDPAKFIVLDADKIKSMMPEYEGWNAAQVHEESGEIFDNVARMARERGLNVVLDKTMKTAKSAVADVQAFKDAGYHTEAHYMHLPRQEAAKRAVQRFIDGGANGRYVPISVVLSNTSNEGSFDDVRKLVDAWSFRDNNVAKGDKPILISESSRGGDAQEDSDVNSPPEQWKQFMVYRAGHKDERTLSHRNAGDAMAVSAHIGNSEDHEKPHMPGDEPTHVHAFKVAHKHPEFGKYETIQRGADDRKGREDGKIGRGSFGGGVAHAFPEDGFDEEYMGSVPIDDLRQSMREKHGGHDHAGFDYHGTVRGADAIRAAKFRRLDEAAPMKKSLERAILFTWTKR